MGWAKYYEDNLSIINDRLLYLCAEKKEYLVPEHLPVHKVEQVLYPARNNRAELKIHFFEAVDHITARKLQINGWWWSNLNKCWCNYNTAINRAFTEKLQYKTNIITVAGLERS